MPIINIFDKRTDRHEDNRVVDVELKAENFTSRIQDTSINLVIKWVNDLYKDIDRWSQRLPTRYKQS